MIFELSNEERKYLGLNEVKETWIRKELTKDYIIYIEENKLVKRIQSQKDCYYESDVLYNLSENHKFILPKTKHGKAKKLTESSVRNLKNGMYLFWWNNKVILANGKCEQSYYESDIAGFNISTLDDFKDWIKKWIKTTLEEELKEITIFNQRTHVPVSPGQKGVFFLAEPSCKPFDRLAKRDTVRDVLIRQMRKAFHAALQLFADHGANNHRKGIQLLQSLVQPYRADLDDLVDKAVELLTICVVPLHIHNNILHGSFHSEKSGIVARYVFVRCATAKNVRNTAAQNKSAPCAHPKVG